MFSTNPRLEISITIKSKYTAYIIRKENPVFKAFMWAMVLVSLDLLKLSCIFLICLQREKMSRIKTTRDTVKGMNMNTEAVGKKTCDELVNKRALESSVEFLKL